MFDDLRGYYPRVGVTRTSPPKKTVINRKGRPAAEAPTLSAFNPRRSSFTFRPTIAENFPALPTPFTSLQAQLVNTPRRWVVTGAAGFIGSHLVETLLKLGQTVVGLDNLETGRRANLEEIRTLVTPEQWARFRLAEGDICRLEDCQAACAGADYVLHQAALGSVPRSLATPLRTHAANVDGFLNMLVAARDAKVQRLVYASSSSVYGDHPALPKVETVVGRPLSPYAATKVADELYAGVFFRSYGLPVIGLRYFNVFGPRQDPEGAYAAVIPKWFAALVAGEDIRINGDGRTSRDFCFVANVVQANLLAATAPAAETVDRLYNIACGDANTLLELFDRIRALVAAVKPAAASATPIFGPERVGDVRHSLANIDLAKARLGYRPTHSLAQGLEEAARWYLRLKAPQAILT